MGRDLSYMFGGVVLLVMCLAFLFRPEFSRPTFGLVLQQGDVMNVALENYRLDHQTYPDNLGTLVPEYLKSIEKPKKYGRQLRLQLLSSVKWEYELAEDRESYYLGITDGSRFGYASVSEEWTFRP